MNRRIRITLITFTLLGIGLCTVSCKAFVTEATEWAVAALATNIVVFHTTQRGDALGARTAPDSGCVQPPPDMVAWWPADANAEDVTSSPDNGALHGGATFAPGEVAQAFSLNGTTAYVSAPDAPKINFGMGDFSIDAWIETSNVTGVHAIVDKRVSDGDQEFIGYVLYTSSGKLGAQLADGTASSFVSMTNVADGVFHHVALTVVRSSSTGGILYVDGMPIFNFDPTGRQLSLTNNAELRIGHHSDHTILNTFFDGRIDEVELFKRALSAAEVQAIFKAGSLGKCKCTITCPNPITKSNDPNLCGAFVAYPDPMTSTGCGVVTCDPRSQSFFQTGTTTVTCSTAAGRSCTFTVRVNDIQPPFITCQNLTVVATPLCPFGATAKAIFTVTTADNCPGPVTIECKDQNNNPVISGQNFPVGTSIITCTATDASGNTAACSFTIKAFSFCLKGGSGDVVLVNAQTGDYLFCCGGVLIASGRGTVAVKGCLVSVRDFTGNRRVLIMCDGAAMAGTATLQSPPGIIRCSILDTGITNQCTCP